MKLADVERLFRESITATELYFDNIKTLPTLEALVAFYKLKKAREAIDAEMKRLTALYQFQQYHPIPEVMIEANIRNYTDDSLGVRFGLSTRVSAKILDKAEAFKWLRAEGQGGLITETVNAQTLASFAKTFIEENGEDLPPELFQVKETTMATTTKASAKKKKL